MPAAKITNSTNQTAPTGGGTEPVKFDTVLYDTSGFHSAEHPNRLTAPVEGIYLIGATAAFSANSTGDRIINIVKNGSTNIGVSQGTNNRRAGLDTCIDVVTQFKLAKGDYVEAEQGAPDATGTINLVTANECFPSLEMALLTDASS